MKTRLLFGIIILLISCSCNETSQIQKERESDAKFRMESSPEEVYNKMVSLYNEYIDMPNASDAKTTEEKEQFVKTKQELYERIEAYSSNGKLGIASPFSNLLFKEMIQHHTSVWNKIEESKILDKKIDTDNAQLLVSCGVKAYPKEYTLFFEKVNGEWKIFKSEFFNAKSSSKNAKNARKK